MGKTKKIEETEDVRCPKCGTEDFSEKSIESTGYAEYIIIKYACNHCNTKFQVEYRAVHITIV